MMSGLSFKSDERRGSGQHPPASLGAVRRLAASVTKPGRKHMADSARDLVVLMTHGADHELSSVGFTIANGGMTAGLLVSIFLTAAAQTRS